MKTGWPTPHLMQDDCRKLSIWFATRLDARYVFLKNLETTMKTYEVELERVSYVTIIIEAENEDAAEAAAWKELANGDFKHDSASWRVESVEEVFS